MLVSREERHVGDRVVAQVAEHQVALPAEAVPRVGAQIQAGVTGQRQVQGAHLRRVHVDEADRGDHHRVADQLPAHTGLLGRGEAVEEPLPLRRAQHRPTDRLEVVAHDRPAQQPEERRAEVLVAVLAAVEDEQLGQVAPTQIPEHPAAVDRPHRHVLEPRLVRRGAAFGELGQERPVVVVGHLVVVPRRDDRMRGVGGLQVGVAAVQAVSLAVALEGVGVLDVLVAQTALQLDRERLVDVVAEEQHRVEVLGGDVAPRPVEAAGVGLARGERQSQRRR